MRANDSLKGLPETKTSCQMQAKRTLIDCWFPVYITWPLLIQRHFARPYRWCSFLLAQLTLETMVAFNHPKSLQVESIVWLYRTIQDGYDVSKLCPVFHDLVGRYNCDVIGSTSLGPAAFQLLWFDVRAQRWTSNQSFDRLSDEKHQWRWDNPIGQKQQMTKSPLGLFLAHFEDATELILKGPASQVMTHGLPLRPVSSDWRLHHLAFLAGKRKKAVCWPQRP